MVATLFGPRLLYRFLQDRVTQRTVGLFMATFVYIGLCFLVTHESPDSRFVPQITLITSWLLVIVSFASLVYYSHRIAVSIQNPDMIARIAHDVYPSVIGSHRRAQCEGDGVAPDDAAVLARADAGAVVACPQSGYVQHVEHGPLVAAARRVDALVVLRFRPGQFVLRGEPLAAISPASAAADLEVLVDRHVAIGMHRTLAQDPEFAIAQIVEIAIRALSPAVNDTFTGVACVDWLGDALLVLAEGPPIRGNWYDTTGALRVWSPAVRIERLVKLAFDQIRQASATTPVVLVRQLEVIRRVGPRMPDAARRALAEQAEAIRETATALVALDRRDLEAAYERARAEAATELLPRQHP
jgi:uncharacterized membrane protein